MESPNAPPAHDFFTPAWLKLPDPQFAKRSAVSPQPSESQRRFSNSSNGSHRNNSSANNGTNGLTNGSNGSADSRFNSTIHDSPTYLSNSRHNSFGSEQQFNKSNPQSTGNVNGLRSKKSVDSSPRSLFRLPYRDKSGGYHSNPKNNRNFDSFKTNYKKFNKFSDYNLDNESNGKNEENCNVFNQEFPSLVNNVNGEQSNANKVESAWTNPSTKCKVLSTSKNMQLIHSTVSNFDNSEGKSNPNGTAKSIIAPMTRNVSLIGKKQIGILKENGVYSRIQPVLTKTAAHTTSASMEILVKNPKKMSNKDFLKSIQNDQNKDKNPDKDCNRFGEKFEKLEITANNRNIEDLSPKSNLSQKYSPSYENDLKNARNINNLLRRPEPCDDPVLSSSLEAEHRLLMELGWKEEPDDDPSYAPLTEDEVKEFKDHYGLKQLQRKEWSLHSNQTIHLLSRPTFQDSEDLEDESSSSSDDD